MRLSLQTYLSAFVAIAFLTFLTACDSTTDPTLDEDTPSVEFASSGAGAVPVDSTVQIGVRLNNPDGNQVSVEVMFAEPASSVTADELAAYTTQTVTFPGSADHGAVENVTVDISDVDISDGPQEAFFALQNLRTDGAARISGTREFALNIGAEPIADAKARSREAGSGNATVTVQGIVTRSRGDFTRIQDDTGGLTIRHTFGPFDDALSAGEIDVGHEIIVTGTVSYFSGLAQIDGDDLSEYAVISTGNPMPQPLVATLQDIADDPEFYKSRLVRVENLSVINTGDATFSAASDYEVEDESGNSQSTGIDMRIGNAGDTAVNGMAIPQEPFTFVGVTTQFNAGFGGAIEPDEGYQLLPVEQDDIVTDEDLDDPDDPDVVTVAEARAMSDGSEVIVEAILTRGMGRDIYFQDDTGGLQAFSSDGWDELEDGTMEAGDLIRFSGSMSSFNEARQLDVEELEVISAGEGVPEPVTLTVAEYVNNMEDYQGQLIRLENVTIDDKGDAEFQGGGADGSYEISDGSGETAILRFNSAGESEYVGEPIPSGEVTIIGPTTRRNDEARVLAIRDGDIIEEDEDEGAQEVTIAEGKQMSRQQGSGNVTVTMTGVVTRAQGDFTRIQDDTGGFTIRQTGGSFSDEVADGTIEPGVELTVTGTITYFSGLAQIDGGDLEEYEIVSTGNDLPDPFEVTLEDIADDPEFYKSRLVRVEGLTIDTDDEEFEAGSDYTITDGSNGGDIILRTPNASDTEIEGEPIPSGEFTFIGVLGQFNAGFGGAIEPDEGYQLLVIEQSDIEED